MRTAFAVLLIISVLGGGATGRADSVPIRPAAGSPPWSDPLHRSPLERLAGRIATRIAARRVTVRCATPTAWTAFTLRHGVNPALEPGYVITSWPTKGGLPNGPPSIASYTELSPSACLTLQRFAVARIKPTKCRLRGRGLGPCFTGSVSVQRNAFWTNYAGYAQAILGLTHESIHLGGAVGGRLRSGALVGDQLAEAHAECYGLQWMQYAAVELGDTADDAIAIARYEYKVLYPQLRGTPYWSAACRPGGPMDIRDPRAPWP